MSAGSKASDQLSILMDSIVSELTLGVNDAIDERDSSSSSTTKSVNEWQMHLDSTFSMLQFDSEISGFLLKQSPSGPGGGATWKRRFFILTADPTMFMFRTNTTNTPITHLCVEAWRVQTAATSGAAGGPLALELTGEGADDNGHVTRVTWVVKCEGEAALRQWAAALARVAPAAADGGGGSTVGSSANGGGGGGGGGSSSSVRASVASSGVQKSSATLDGSAASLASTDDGAAAGAGEDAAECKAKEGGASKTPAASSASAVLGPVRALVLRKTHAHLGLDLDLGRGAADAPQAAVKLKARSQFFGAADDHPRRAASSDEPRRRPSLASAFNAPAASLSAPPPNPVQFRPRAHSAVLPASTPWFSWLKRSANPRAAA